MSATRNSSTIGLNLRALPLSAVTVSLSGVRRKFPGGAKFRHNRMTSQINFRGIAVGTTILGVWGHAPGKILQNYT